MKEVAQDIADQFVERVLVRPEGLRLEFKLVSGRMVHKALETLCAFANTDGGVLLLGVEDASAAKGRARLVGVEDNAEAVDDLVRKVRTQFSPVMTTVRFLKIPTVLKSKLHGFLVHVQVQASNQVHSIIDGGTWVRLERSNRLMDAHEVTELSYRRGARSAEKDTVSVALELLDTRAWRAFTKARQLTGNEISDQLCRIGLADFVDSEGDRRVHPRRAAVLLFADDPGGQLAAASGSRSEVRVMVYDGKAALPTARPNMRKTPVTVRGPLIDLIDKTISTVLRELDQGMTLSNSGFRAHHVYPERVLKEAIVNAVIHRDYRLNRDIFVRIFDDRIEIESPGVFPGGINAANIDRAGSFARNPLIAQNLREFPSAPNIDAGEGVPMMFAEMAAARLYPPQYRRSIGPGVESVTVTLLNHERPSAWDEVSHWLDEHGSIANADLRKIARVDTLKASKMLGSWVAEGLLAGVPGRGKRNMAYMRLEQPDGEALLLKGVDNKAHD